MRLRRFTIAAALLGCDADSSAGIDAGGIVPDAARGCWPDEPRTPKGLALLGTGRNRFEPMPEQLPLEYGTQDGFHLVAHVRMSGFDPGDPYDHLNPANPTTRIRAFFDDTNVPLRFDVKCGSPYGYLASASGDYELAQGSDVVFETCWRSDHLFGKRIRIEAEILDDSGGYTRDVKVVTAAAPESFHPVDHDSPGCLPRVLPPRWVP